MRKLPSRILRLKSIFWTIVCGILVSLATGLIENRPDISIVEAKYYGYPIVWCVTKTLQPTEFRFTALAIDTAFWIVISLVALVALETLRSKVGFEYKTLLFPVILFIPMGLVMDLVHEFGHAMWGIALGGRLTYMKVAFFEIYPRFAITSQFILGYVHIEGLTTGFQHGLFLLGGSLTTNIVAWLLAIILLRIRFGHKTQVSLRLLGLFGLLDLPFYILFPQIGLQHWLFLGGGQPEPLVGARMMGISDLAFYITVVLSTLGLVFLYFKPIREKTEKKIKAFLGRDSLSIKEV